MTDTPPPRVRVLVTNDVVDYPHNDLANAAFALRERLKGAFENEERLDGIFLDMIAFVTMIAFALEAYANFLGDRIITPGDDEAGRQQWLDFERQPVREKLKALRKIIGFEIDWNKRPFVTVEALIELRNMFAHSKPHRPKEREAVMVGTDPELRQMLRAYKPEYEARLTWEFVTTAYDDVEAIWKAFLEAARIDVYETFGGGAQGLEFIELVPD